MGRKWFYFLAAFWEKRKEKIKLLNHSLLLTKSVWGKEREKVQIEGFSAVFDISSKVDLPKHAFSHS